MYIPGGGDANDPAGGAAPAVLNANVLSLIDLFYFIFQNGGIVQIMHSFGKKCLKNCVHLLFVWYCIDVSRIFSVAVEQTMLR